MDPINQKSGSNKWLYVAIGALVLILLVVLVKGSMTHKVSVGGYNAEYKKNMDGSVTVKSDYGTTTVNSNKWPDTWPSDVPVYTNGTVTNSGSTSAQAGVEGSEVMFTTGDSTQSVLDFYKGGLTASGWASMYPGKAISGMQMGANITLAAKKDKRSVTVMITDLGNGQSRVTVIVATMPAMKTGM